MNIIKYYQILVDIIIYYEIYTALLTSEHGTDVAQAFEKYIRPLNREYIVLRRNSP